MSAASGKDGDIGKPFKELRNMEVNNGDDLREYVGTLESILFKIKLELDLASEELKIKLKNMPPRQVEMSKAELFGKSRWTAHYLSSAADHIKSAQGAAYRCVRSFQNQFSDEAIQERREAREAREAKRAEKERKNRKR